LSRLAQSASPAAIAAGPLAESSDGFVPCWSSHLPQTESEVVVPAGHSVYKNPAAVAEIKRIFRLPAHRSL